MPASPSKNSQQGERKTQGEENGKGEKELNRTKQTHKCWICSSTPSHLCRKKGHVWLCEVEDCRKRFNVNFGCFVHSYSEGYNKLAELRFKELQGVQPSKAEYKEILSYSTTLKLAESSPEASNKVFPTAVSDGDESVSRIRQIAAKADNISKTIAIRDFGAVTPSAVLQSSVAKTSVRRTNLEPPPNNHLQPRSSTQSAARTTPSLNDDGTPSNKRGAKNRRFYADLKRRAAKQGCGVRKATKAKVPVDVKTRTAGSEE